MVASILAALAAIPEILAEIKALNAWLKKANDEKWFSKENQIFNSDLPKDQSMDDFKKTAGDIQNQIGGL